MNEAEFRADVCQSQSIERIKVNEHSQLFKQHLKATQYVYEKASNGEWPNLLKVHQILMLNEVDIPGSFRTWGVYLSDKKDGKKNWCPNSQHIESLMSEWEESCQHIRSNSTYFGDLLETVCLVHYYHFLVIHPFEDGNGRTGRLMCNALRLCVGLPWHTFTTDVHPLYVQKLRAYEADFKKENSELYDPD